MTIYNLNFQTAYSQFYIVDGMANCNTASDNFWTEDAYLDRLAIEDNVLGVGIESYGNVKAKLLYLSEANYESSFNEYDHIVEGGIKIESGILQIKDCPNNAIQLTMAIEPGNYRVRIYSENLAEAYIDEDEGNDCYKIEIWPDNNTTRSVLKRYQGK